jgi:hypothetical protein
VGRRRHAFALPCPARGGKARTAGRSHDLLEAAQADRPPRLQVQRDKVVQQKRTLARRRRAFDQRQAPRRRRLRVPLERRRQVLEHFLMMNLIRTSWRQKKSKEEIRTNN